MQSQVISLAGELLNHAEELIRDGLHPSEILEGYKKAAAKVCACLCPLTRLLAWLIANATRRRLPYLKRLSFRERTFWTSRTRRRLRSGFGCGRRAENRTTRAEPLITSPRNSTQGTISSKQYGCEDLVTRLVAKACIDVCPKNPKNFNVDNVRVCKARSRRAAVARRSLLSACVCCSNVSRVATDHGRRPGVQRGSAGAGHQA